MAELPPGEPTYRIEHAIVIGHRSLRCSGHTAENPTSFPTQLPAGPYSPVARTAEVCGSILTPRTISTASPPPSLNGQNATHPSASGDRGLNTGAGGLT